MIGFTPLERAALETLCRLDGGDGAIIAAQLATGLVVERKNTGAGFFTYFSVDRATPPIARLPFELWLPSVAIEGLANPLLLMLFLKDGYASFIEGATVEESTIGIDLDTVRFDIII